MTVDLAAAVRVLNALGIEAEVPDRDRLVLNIRGICVNEFSDWVSIELRHADPSSEWFESAADVAEYREILDADHPAAE